MTLTKNTIYLLLSIAFMLPMIFVNPEAFWDLPPTTRFLLLTSFLTGLGLAGTIIAR